MEPNFSIVFIFPGDPVADGAGPAHAAVSAGRDGRRDGNAPAAAVKPNADGHTNAT